MMMILYCFFWLINKQTPAQPLFKGHLPRSRGCPLNRGSAEFDSIYILPNFLKAGNAFFSFS